MENKLFNRIYKNYSGILYNYALWLTRNKDASNDIIQLVFLKLLKQKIIPKKENELQAWLYKITKNAFFDLYRKHKRFIRLRIKYAKETPLFSKESPEKKAIWGILDKLNPYERSVLYLHFHTGHSFKEVAKILDMKESAVRARSVRALKKLRNILKKELT